MLKYELLSPAGNFAMLSAAVDAGADAVYFGIQGFNMRAAAKNFAVTDLKEISRICAGKKKYITLNTIIYQHELKEIEKLIRKVSEKIDAIICSDLSVMMLCKKYEVPFHISTQCSVSNALSAAFYRDLGAQRIVLARELSLAQISEIAKKTKPLEIESFCHGALCVSESGRCFTSQFICGKSANRGECIQPCRRAYKITEIDNTHANAADEGVIAHEHELVLQNNRVMSAKDLCTLPFIEKMKAAGITTFKIEGRNRTPEYVSSVTKAYRKALDKKLSDEEIAECLEELKRVYNRGFSSGFFIKMPTNDDFSKSDFGEQTEKKVFLGKVSKYWGKAGVASLKINYGTLKLGDEVYIIGNKTGAVRVKVESMQIDSQPIGEIHKGQEAGIKLPKCRVNDEVYLIAGRGEF